MIKRIAKKVVNVLPSIATDFFTLMYYKNRVGRGKFSADEPEYEILNKWVSDGDCVVDVGANIGQYTHKLSDLVGKKGLVIAVEPSGRNYLFLSKLLSITKKTNTLTIRAAASDCHEINQLEIPLGRSGDPNYYQGRLSDNAGSGNNTENVFAFPLDALLEKKKVALIKIDAEGHEIKILEGLEKTAKKDRPVMIIEGSPKKYNEFAQKHGYTIEQIPGSPNCILAPEADRP